jgi:hypothetical protein
MKALTQKTELAYFYHHWMEEFNNLKMEHVLMKVKLLIFKKRSKISQEKQWEMYKE